METNQGLIQMESLPDELKQAVLEKDLTLEIATQLTQLNDHFVNYKMVQVIKRKKRYERDLLKNALAAVEKSKKMKQKMGILKKVTDSGVILSSVWNFGNRDNYAGDASFHGNAPT